jgi:hypothetical protein
VCFSGAGDRPGSVSSKPFELNDLVDTVAEHWYADSGSSKAT